MNLEYTKIRDRHTSPCLKGINLLPVSLWKCKTKLTMRLKLFKRFTNDIAHHKINCSYKCQFKISILLLSVNKMFTHK